MLMEIIRWGAMLLLGAGALYFHYNARLKEQASGLITQAEEVYKDATRAGGLKFNWVVDSLYALIPALLRPLITRAFIENLVQTTFDSVERYAKLQLDRLLAQKED